MIGGSLGGMQALQWALDTPHEILDRARRGGEGGSMKMDLDFEVEHYLEHQGEIFVQRFDALSYLYLSRVMDYFEPFADPRLDLARVDTSVLAISFDSDWRFGSEHSRFIVERLQAGGVPARHVEVSSPWGHDSFCSTSRSTTSASPRRSMPQRDRARPLPRAARTGVRDAHDARIARLSTVRAGFNSDTLACVLTIRVKHDLYVAAGEAVPPIRRRSQRVV